MHLTKKDIESLERIRRLNMINSITGIKPANLIGTRSKDGNTNLAVFSSVVHLGSHPALVGFILRPQNHTRRHTAENIVETGLYTINHIHKKQTKAAHYTSAKWPDQVSEFKQCGFSEEYIDGFAAPFVSQSLLKFGMQLEEMIPIRTNGTVMVVGRVVHLIYPDDAFDTDGHLDLESLGTAGVSGLNTYYELKYKTTHPYARIEDFEKDLIEPQ